MSGLKESGLERELGVTEVQAEEETKFISCKMFVCQEILKSACTVGVCVYLLHVLLQSLLLFYYVP